MAFLYSAILANVHLLIKCIIGSGLMSLIILFTIDRKIEAVDWNRKIIALWFFMGIIQLFSGVIVSKEYLPMAMIWLVLFPVLFIVWEDRRDFNALFIEVAKAGNAVVLLMIFSSFLFVPISEGSYGGILKNANGIGQWVTFGFPLVIFLINRKKRNVLQKCGYYSELALMFFLLIVSRGRTAVLAVGCMCIAYLFFLLRLKKRDFSYWIKEIGEFCICAIIVITVFKGINQLSAINISLKLESFSSVTVSSEEQNSLSDSNYSSEAENGGHWGKNNKIDALVGRFLGKDKAEAGLDNLSSGRIGIWKKVLEKANWIGNPSREHIVTYRNGDVGANAHSTILQFVYDNGVLAGIVYTILVFYGGFILLKRALDAHNLQTIDVYFLIVHIGYAVTGLLTSLNLPFLYLISFLYYLTYAAIFSKKREYQ